MQRYYKGCHLVVKTRKAKIFFLQDGHKIFPVKVTTISCKSFENSYKQKDSRPLYSIAVVSKS